MSGPFDNPWRALALNILIAILTAAHVHFFGFGKVLWVSALGSFAACLPVFAWYFTSLVNPWPAWGLIFANLAANLVVLAQIHASSGVAFSGVACPDSQVCVSNLFVDGLYFSIVTFTTLGYGDFQPVGYGRYIAATQALTGYLVLGLTVGAFLHLAQGEKKSG